MLSDIASAGDAARLQLEQMTGVAQDLNLLHDRVSTIDERMASLLRGIIYLISLRWVLSRHVSGSEVVNVFSFENGVLDQVQGGLLEVSEIAVQAEIATETTEISTQTDEAVMAHTDEAAVVDVAHTDKAVVAQTVEISTQTAAIEIPTQTVEGTGTSISTQTENTEFDQISSLINPLIQAHGMDHVLWRMRQFFDRAMSWSEDPSEYSSEYSSEDNFATTRNNESETSEIQVEVIREMGSTEHSPATEVSNTLTEHSPVTDVSNTFTEHSPVNEVSTQGSMARSSDLSTLRSPRRLNKVVDNPTYQPTSSLDTGSPSSPLPVDDDNPYQFHRHRLYGVKRLFLYLCELIEQI